MIVGKRDPTDCPAADQVPAASRIFTILDSVDFHHLLEDIRVNGKGGNTSRPGRYIPPPA